MKKEHKLNTKTGSEAQTKYKEWKSSLIQQRSIYRNLKTQKEIQNKLYLEKWKLKDCVKLHFYTKIQQRKKTPGLKILKNHT